MAIKILGIETNGGNIILDKYGFDFVKKMHLCVDKSTGYVICYYNGASKNMFLLHRLLINCPKNKIVDHINGDKLDNRLCNLRICDKSKNGMNRGMQKNNSSGFKGVYKLPYGNWCSRISADGKDHYLGSYKTKEEARQIYISACVKYHKEYANY
jgi:hypothetical protein